MNAGRPIHRDFIAPCYLCMGQDRPGERQRKESNVADGMHHHGGGHSEHGGPTDTHGMAIVGEESVYLSHLPMFEHPNHEFQVILEVTFTDEGDDPQAAYAADRRQTQTRLYTLAPEKFFLPDLIPTDTHDPPRRSFAGSIHRGHFEKGGEPIADALVNVVNIVHFRRFDPEAEKPRKLAYLLFGKPAELFLAHRITRPPDFDQILPVQVTGHVFTEEDLTRGVEVVISERSNSLTERLQEGDRVAAEAQLGGEGSPETVEVEIEAGTEYYLEEGELELPANFGQTEAERAAGFR